VPNPGGTGKRREDYSDDGDANKPANGKLGEEEKKNERDAGDD
jgi:hypothetical protein